MQVRPAARMGPAGLGLLGGETRADPSRPWVDRPQFPSVTHLQDGSDGDTSLGPGKG